MSSWLWVRCQSGFSYALGLRLRLPPTLLDFASANNEGIQERPLPDFNTYRQARAG